MRLGDHLAPGTIFIGTTCDNQEVPDTERRVGKMRVVDDAAEVASAGGWVIQTHAAVDVGSLVPRTFEAYARIFHPAMREADERDLPLRACGESRTGAPIHRPSHGVIRQDVSWREVADANGTLAHPAMEWTAITGRYELSWSGTQPGVWDEVPRRGSLPHHLTSVLCGILAAFTATPNRCWCAIWEGCARIAALRSDTTLPRLGLPHRPMVLTDGPLSGVPDTTFRDPTPELSDDRLRWQPVERYQSPSLWWPDDRAWCVATDVDLQTTYIGASTDCVDRLIGDRRVEAMRVPADQDISLDADTVNPPPSGDRAKA